MKRIVCIAAFLAATSAHADQLDRLIAATEQLSFKSEVFYISRVPALEGKLPDLTVDDEMRGALSCILDEIETQIDAPAVEKYVSAMETLSAQEITSFEQLQNANPGLPDDVLLNVMSTCGMIEISMRRMQESGMWEAMQDPDVLQAIMADQ